MPPKGTTMPAEQRDKIRAAITEQVAADRAATTRKRCCGCKLDLPVDRFKYRHGKHRHLLRSYCIDCEPEANRAAVRRYHHRQDPEVVHAKQRRKELRIRYGITPEDYDRMLAEQGGGCAICGVTEPGETRRYFAVDHEHSDTGPVRGLLCGPCNRAIGLLGDDPDRIEAAAAYLRARQH